MFEIFERLIDQAILKWTVAQLDPGHLLMSFPIGGSKCIGSVCLPLTHAFKY